MAVGELIEAVRVMTRLAAITRKPGLRRAAQRDAGVYLERLRRDRTRVEWVDLVRVNCELGVSRAYELMALAAGKDTRAANAARQRRYKAKKSKT